MMSTKSQYDQSMKNATDPQSESDLHPALERPSGVTVSNATTRNVSLIVNPMENEFIRDVEHQPGQPIGAEMHSETSSLQESPGTSQMSPPPSYHDIPGTVPAHQGTSRGPPPSYEDAVDPNADPPSYDSLFGRIRDAHKASRNFLDFFMTLILLLYQTIGRTIACGINVVIPVSMIIVGSVYFNDCPAEPCVPVFLIVGGSLSLLKYKIELFTRMRRSNSEDEGQEASSHPLLSLINCFLCGWFITGCVWVYSIYKPIMDVELRDDPNYCNSTVYIFAFWLITTAYIFLGLYTSCNCCHNIVSVVLKAD